MNGYERARFFFGKSIPVGLILVSTVIAVLVGELLVRFVLDPGDFLLATLIDDPVLNHRIKPHTTGHDALGFRNPAVPERANIVAIGDSQTYGVSAARDGSWPHQLGTFLHEPVYNMALGGYGPLEYLYLAEHEAKELRPQLLLVGFYFGNDLIEAYNAAHHRSYWHYWREAGSADPGAPEDQRSAEPTKRFATARDWLSRNSLFYSLLRVTLPWLASWEKDHMAQQVTPDRQMIWIDPSNHSVRTIFTPQLRLSVLDPELPRVQEGLQITKRAFTSLKSDADDRDIQLIVVLIPTKERAYCSYLKDSGEGMPNTLVRLCDAEEQVKENLVQFFAARKIAYVDVTGAMEENVRKQVQIYPTDSDSHPQATGYGVIARAVYDAVRRQHYEKMTLFGENRQPVSSQDEDYRLRITRLRRSDSPDAVRTPLRSGASGNIMPGRDCNRAATLRGSVWRVRSSRTFSRAPMVEMMCEDCRFTQFSLISQIAKDSFQPR